MAIGRRRVSAAYGGVSLAIMYSTIYYLWHRQYSLPSVRRGDSIKPRVFENNIKRTSSSPADSTLTQYIRRARYNEGNQAGLVWVAMVTRQQTIVVAGEWDTRDTARTPYTRCGQSELEVYALNTNRASSRPSTRSLRERVQKKLQ